MNKRIKLLRKKLGMTQEEFASKIKLSRNFIAQIESGAKMPSERTISDICREFNVRYQWLTEGIEPIYDELDTRIDAIMTGQNKFAKNLFREFAKLDENEWKMLEKLIKNIVKESSESKKYSPYDNAPATAEELERLCPPIEPEERSKKTS